MTQNGLHDLLKALLKILPDLTSIPVCVVRCYLFFDAFLMLLGVFFFTC